MYGIEWTLNNGSNLSWDSVELGFHLEKPVNPLVGFYVTGIPYEDTPQGRVYLNNDIEFTISNGRSDNYGVELFTTNRSCGIIDGSQYEYMHVFDQTDFQYLPINSNTTIQTVKVEDKFPTEPEYLDLKDPLGKDAPIYPMDSVVSFVPDPRLAVTVDYYITGRIVGEGIVTSNPSIIIKHTVVQEETDYRDQLEQLKQHTMLGNTRDYDYSEGYPYDYPYTTVSTEAPLTGARGDVWYNPASGQRQYFNIGDIPETLTILNKGRNYRKTKGVECVWIPKDICLDQVDREIPYGLRVDLELINGTVENVSISDDAMPKGWEDGDEVVIRGGDNQARLLINIQNPSGWVDSYIFKT